MTAIEPGLGAGVAASPRAVEQWWALTSRGLMGIIRTGEIAFSLIAPALFALCFYLPLRTIMNQYPGMNYAQYLMPIIALQSMGFAATSAAMRSATDTDAGINRRFRAMPIPSAIPVLARTSTNIVLLVVALICACIASLIIGWRPVEGGQGVGLVVLSLAIGLLFVLLADAVGAVAPSPEATSQILGLPLLIFGMLSTGFVPETQFPEWIRPFVRNQPFSQLTGAMRSLNDGTATWSTLFPAFAWMAVFAALCVVLYMLARRKLG
ncbi:ABC transporter permease [Gordonia aichiensis]|uniref:Putative ABC transporter permease protein n=1 Tax=Gordonia aichiensis NBRC 108223 TaxID=1220583 RepID=L7KHT2_9ACTN|nr:ABC transporter permease [Gordonia aichiensis]GAC47278.1 putative ABC transporter permease protein [Gordonia aichiensis NBRC 108223]